jgi:hypothetical protein
MKSIIKDIAREYFRSCFEHSIVIGTGLALATAFIIMAITGRYACEPNKLILYSEICMSLFFVIYGTIKLTNVLRKYNR